MSPESNQNPLPGMPASLPSAPSQQPIPSQPAGVPTSVPPFSDSTRSANAAEQASAQARVLVDQYQQDPYRLSGALQKLKARYLADQFHISAKTAEE